MASPVPSAARGYLLALVGGLFLTLDVPTIRLAGVETAGVLLVRSSLEVLAALALWLVWRRWRGSAPPLVPGRAGLIACLCYGLGTIVFLYGVQLSGETGETGAFLFLLASSPLLAAILAIVFLREWPSPATWVALVAVLVGVGLIVGNPAAGSWEVKLAGFFNAVMIASALTVSRGSGRDMGFTPLVACILPAIVGAALLLRGDGSPAMAGDGHWSWLALNGAILMPIAFFCLAQAPRYIPAPQAALFYLLETTLAPVWLFLIFGETVAPEALTGGALIVGAVAFDTLASLRRSRWRAS